ncbi:hypothetical protein AGMMS49944_17450 [Spirochaetia bacterium]|nr:hypothetical protein AGMMS49944_17450 [Spirochaetia bacterium]
MKTLAEYDKEYNEKGRPNKKTISLKITEKPVYYLFTTKKDSDIAVSKNPSITTKLFPLEINNKKINKRQKYYEWDKDIETAIENGELDEDKSQSIILFKSILYDDTGMDNFAELTDGHHKAQTHLFIKIYDKTQIYSVLYYLNNNRRLYTEIKWGNKRTFQFDREDFIVFFSLDKNGDLQKNPSMLPVIDYKYRYKYKGLFKMIVIQGKYRTMRELLELEGDTEKIDRLDNHKEASRAYRKEQAKEEDTERAKGIKPVLIRRKRRIYNSPGNKP